MAFGRHISAALSAFILALAILFVSALSSQMSAHARIKLCNETSYVLQAATAYTLGVASKTEGWQVILPGDCVSARAEIPAQAQAFVFAKSDRAHAGEGLVFDGLERFCIGENGKDFVVEGRRKCRRRGYVEANFAPVTGRGANLLVTFTEKNNYGKRRAIMAGVQRLLSDLQYDIGVIDGFGGRRTTDAAAAYRLRFQVSGKPEGQKLIAQLIKTARQKAAERGLILCNKTDNLIWAASGELVDGGLNSSGWLRVAPNQCAQAINHDLTDRFYFYYAEAVDENGQAIIRAGRQRKWSGDFDMCVKNTRFSIIGTQNCRARGYETAKFVKIDTGATSKWLVNLEE